MPPPVTVEAGGVPVEANGALMADVTATAAAVSTTGDGATRVHLEDAAGVTDAAEANGSATVLAEAGLSDAGAQACTTVDA